MCRVPITEATERVIISGKLIATPAVQSSVSEGAWSIGDKIYNISSLCHLSLPLARIELNESD